MSKMNFVLSDSAARQQNVNYLFKTTAEPLKRLSGSCEIRVNGDRINLSVTLPDEYAELFNQILTDKVADVIAVNYKYEYFTRYIRTCGLDEIEYEMLIAALISADLEEDKSYVGREKLNFKDFSIDGYYNFRLRPLKEKWSEIVTYIPNYFSFDKLSEFISYIVCEKSKKRAIVVDGKVYDGRNNRMLKGMMTGKIKKGLVAREVILSGFSEVELASKISETDEKYLVSFFGDKIFFKKGKIT